MVSVVVLVALFLSEGQASGKIPKKKLICEGNQSRAAEDSPGDDSIGQCRRRSGKWRRNGRDTQWWPQGREHNWLSVKGEQVKDIS